MKKSGKTQAQAIMDYLKQHGSITTLEAFSELGITRISARIFDLRQQGLDIRADRVTVDSRYGKTDVTRYTFDG